MTGFLVIALSNAVVAGAMAVVLLPLARLARRPAVHHAICVLVLLKLVTPPLWRIEVPTVSVEDEPNSEAVATDFDYPRATPDWADYELALPPPAPPPKPIHSWLRLGRIGLFVWIGGSLLCLFVVLVRIVNLRRLLGGARSAPRDVQDRAGALARRLRLSNRPGIWFVGGGLCPMLVALWRTPRVFVPAALWDALDEGQRDALLLHELAHYRRRDHWVRWIELAATVLYWWHPGVWWVRRELRESEEQCCDAWVVWATPGSVRAYLTALMDAIDFGCAGSEQGRGARVPALASGMGHFSQLKRRITMIQQGKTCRAMSWRGFALVCAIGGLLLPVAAGLGQAPPDAKAQDKSDASWPNPLLQSPGDEPTTPAPARNVPQLAITYHDFHRLAGATTAQCANCHNPNPLHVRAGADADPNAVAGADWHREIVARADELAKLREELHRTRQRLAQLERLAAAAGRTADDAPATSTRAPSTPANDPSRPAESRPRYGDYRWATRNPPQAGDASDPLTHFSPRKPGSDSNLSQPTRAPLTSSRAPTGAPPARSEQEKLSALEADVKALLDRIQAAKAAQEQQDQNQKARDPERPAKGY
jgi:beta-lactamase regulating signal transducer with metallopeptidase domain